MSKLLYIHKPSLTAVIQYNPHPDIERIATVDMVAVAETVMMTLYTLGQPKAILAYLMKRRLNVTHTHLADFQTPEDLVLWFIDNHPQTLK